MRDREVAAFEGAATVVAICVAIALGLVLWFAVDGVLHHFQVWGR